MQISHSNEQIQKKIEHIMKVRITLYEKTNSNCLQYAKIRVVLFFSYYHAKS